jgi:hypothetical protein
MVARIELGRRRFSQAVSSGEAAARRPLVSQKNASTT